jgi:hypothetical protein
MKAYEGNTSIMEPINERYLKLMYGLINGEEAKPIKFFTKKEKR